MGERSRCETPRSQWGAVEENRAEPLGTWPSLQAVELLG